MQMWQVLIRKKRPQFERQKTERRCKYGVEQQESSVKWSRGRQLNISAHSTQFYLQCRISPAGSFIQIFHPPANITHVYLLYSTYPAGSFVGKQVLCSGLLSNNLIVNLNL